jgi:hypothetical protein
MNDISDIDDAPIKACFIAYEQGRITAIIKGARNAIEPPDGDYLDYTGDIEVTLNHYISDGEPVEIPEKPSASHQFDYEAGQWTLDIEDAKADAWIRIKASRAAAEFSTFTWGSYIFQCDQDSQMRIQAGVQAAMLNDNMSIVWTLADNTTQTFTATELKQIGQALSDHVSQCHERGRILRGQIDAATTEEDLEAIVW